MARQTTSQTPRSVRVPLRNRLVATLAATAVVVQPLAPGVLGATSSHAQSVPQTTPGTGGVYSGSVAPETPGTRSIYSGSGGPSIPAPSPPATQALPDLGDESQSIAT